MHSEHPAKPLSPSTLSTSIAVNISTGSFCSSSRPPQTRSHPLQLLTGLLPNREPSPCRTGLALQSRSSPLAGQAIQPTATLSICVGKFGSRLFGFDAQRCSLQGRSSWTISGKNREAHRNWRSWAMLEVSGMPRRHCQARRDQQGITMCLSKLCLMPMRLQNAGHRIQTLRHEG